MVSETSPLGQLIAHVNIYCHSIVAWVYNGQSAQAVVANPKRLVLSNRTQSHLLPWLRLKHLRNVSLDGRLIVATSFVLSQLLLSWWNGDRKLPVMGRVVERI